MFRAAAAAAVVAALSAPASAALVVNGGFEEPGLGFRTVNAGQTYGGWTNAGPSNIEFVRAEPAGHLPGLEHSAFEGEYWIDLVGTGSPSAIYQDIAGLSAGQRYEVSWAQAGNVWGGTFNFTMEVVWNGQVVASYTQAHGGNNGLFMNWQEHAAEVVAAGGLNRLMFRAVTGGSARGPALDAVGLTLVPTPGTLAPAGLLALAATRRRR